MYVEDFNTFYQQAEELLLKDPIKTRYVVKYRHTDGKLVLKVTDDDVVRQLTQHHLGVAELQLSLEAPLTSCASCLCSA
jgi:signal recognition particle subunit SRP9